VYYEGYLAAQNGAQDEESIAEPYTDLIQSQNREPGEESIAELVQELIQPHESDRKEDDVKPPVDQVEKQTPVPAPDIIDELDV